MLIVHCVKQAWLRGILTSMGPTIYFQIKMCDGQFPDFGEYISFQLQTCTAFVLSAHCTGGCSSNIVIFNNF